MGVRVDLNVSLDGYATTEGGTPDNPFGEDWTRLTAAYVATRTFRERVFHDTSGEGTTGVDDKYAAAYFEGAWGKPAIIYPFTSSAYNIAPGVLFTEAYDGYLLGSKTLSQEVTYLEGLFRQGAAYLVRNDGWTGQPWASSLPSSP